jgi:hypothetical protein
MNPTTRVKHDDITIDVHDEEDAVTVTTGSYRYGHPGLALTIHFDYLNELVDEDIQDDTEKLLDIAIDRAVGRIDTLNEESVLNYDD